jgi:outer membrane protein TolC
MKWILLLVAAVCGLEALTLKEAEEIALANNPQVQASEQLIEMARQGRLEAISKWLPQLNIYTQGFKTQTTIPLLQVTKPSTFLTELTLTQTLFSSQTLYQIGI